MKSKILSTIFVVASMTLTASAFASGYGPAPSYRPVDGAPASQRGQSAQTISAEQRNAVADDAYGGLSKQSLTASGARDVTTGKHSIYFGH
ncbi:hypothetical protein [Paraburkholderia caribensis]|uniref:hypothetical protein n=1 Tax=Paraburkholderia caribensis TaxID=75105 RepID=UPI0009EBB2E4|nr:hypothetical protein [Paraburkholderia caribensis]